MIFELLKTAAISIARPMVQFIGFVQLVRSERRMRYGIRAARGIALLREWLSHEQRAQFDAFKCFDVTGSKSGKRYRIQHGVSANVHELDDAGHPVMGWCFVPAGNLVPGDVMLAQKIALETNESGALAVAQKFLAPRLPSRTATMRS
jgi:hypothetical protein